MWVYGSWITQNVLLLDPLDLGSCIRAMSWDPRDPGSSQAVLPLDPVDLGACFLARRISDPIGSKINRRALQWDPIGSWIHTVFRLKIFWDHRSEFGIHAHRTRLHLSVLSLINLGKYYLECTGTKLSRFLGQLGPLRKQKKEIRVKIFMFFIKDHETIFNRCRI